MDTTNTPSFTVQSQTPQRQIRHRSLLEHIFIFTLKSPLPLPHEVSEAILLYHLILDDCEAASLVLRKPSGDGDTVSNDLNQTNWMDWMSWMSWTIWTEAVHPHKKTTIRSRLTTEARCPCTSCFARSTSAVPVRMDAVT